MRVTEPLIEGKADRVHIIRHITDIKLGHEEYYNWIKKRLAKKFGHIDIQEKSADLWNLDDLIEVIRLIIIDERKNGNHPYVNVSTGPKVAGIAGMLACMICDAIPYYVRIDYSKKQKIDGLDINPIIYPFVEPPVFRIKKPTPPQMFILTLLDLRGPIRKTDLIDELVNKKIIKPANSKTEDEFSPYAKHGQLRSILDPLEHEWGYVKVETRSKRSDVYITDDGRQAIRMFGIERI